MMNCQVIIEGGTLYCVVLLTQIDAPRTFAMGGCKSAVAHIQKVKFYIDVQKRPLAAAYLLV